MSALERLKARRAAGGTQRLPSVSASCDRPSLSWDFGTHHDCQCDRRLCPLDLLVGSGGAAAAGFHAAATAHRAADAYMAAFDAVFDGSEVWRHPPALMRNGSGLEQAAAARPAPTLVPHPQAAVAAPQPAQPAPTSAWQQPPAASTTAISLSDRNLLCGSVDWARQEAVLGSADHALYSVDLRRRRQSRTLYSKQAGHREWVSAVCHLPDGRIASGGLDSRIWLWPAAGTAPTASKCCVLEGHAGSIVALAPVPAAPSCLISAAYDKRLLCWDCSTGGRLQQALEGHRAPVLQLAAAGGVAASGDRDGCIARWSIGAGKALGKLVQAHDGHCTALTWLRDGSSSSSGGGSGSEASSTSPDAHLLLSGGQDGAVKLWDARTGQQRAAMAAHAGPSGRGAVGSITCMGHLVLTCGADGTVHGLEARAGLQPAWQPLQLPDFPSCAASCGSTLFVGCGNGEIAAVDAATGHMRWSVRAAASAVRTLAASENLLVTGCDHGSVVLFDAAQPQLDA